MGSMAKHSLELDLNDKKWFRYAAFKGKSSLTEDSLTELESLPGLATLSGWAEVIFALMVCAISLSSFYLVDAVKPWLAFLICLTSFLLVFITKRIMTYKKYGFGSKWAMSISKDELKVDKLTFKKHQNRPITIAKNEIAEVLFHYTMDLKRKRKFGEPRIRLPTLHVCEIHLKNGDTHEIDGMRVGLFNVLYLMVFHGYPLSFKGTFAGGAGNVLILLLRMFALSAIASALSMLFVNLKP
ncbi:hypothetical protein NH514_05915 [Pseudoalteromonas sp. ACER1]|nr:MULTISPECIES: hypothetical protein [unclassified Pseudoalteromonas]MCF2846695.1 hypothetical protein [Pseudoalteromonas sp. PAST1]MCO7210278.1 hypothetical protein [Pseudoalteromonas sp. ACER1]